MKKLFRVALVASVAALVLASCASAPTAKKEALEDTYRVIDWQGKSVGTKTPEWVQVAAGDTSFLERDKQYDGQFVFLANVADAKSLEGAKLLANDIDIQAQLAKQINTRVVTKTAGSTVGDKDKQDAYLENVTALIAKATVQGLKQEKSFWVKKNYYKPNTSDLDPDKVVFDYFVLYSISKETVKKLSDKALADADSAEKPKTEAEKTVRENVRKAMAELF